MKKQSGPLFVFFFFAVFLFVACLTSDEANRQVLRMQIDKDNDSLLTFDSLIITVHSKDGEFSQEVFHGVLRTPKQVASMPLDPRVGTDYTISIVGYKGGRIWVNKEVTFFGNVSKSKDVPIKIDTPETVVVIPGLPEILAPSDTSISEGDSLRFRVGVRNPWTGKTTLTLKESIPGATLDTIGRDAGDGYFTWRPSFEQGRTESYAITFVYATATQEVEKIVRVKVINVNRPPKLAAIADQKVKESETLTFKVEASDPDRDSLSLTAAVLPTGATFAAGLFTWKPAEDQVGNYTVRFSAFDGADSNVIAVLVTVGNVYVPPPVTVEITFPANDTTVNFTPITILYTVNGVQLQKKVPLKDEKNRIRIDTTIQNRAGFDTVLITLDTVPPSPPIVVGISPIRSRTPTWTWSSGGNGVGLYRYRLDIEDMSGSTQINETAYTASTDLDVGAHTLYVQERDAAGNWSASGKRTIRIDTTLPPAPHVIVTPSSPTNSTLPTWEWTPVGDDLSGLYRYKLDTNDFHAGAVETKLTRFTPDRALNEGSHTLYVQQQDSAGNWSLAGNASVKIDLTAPYSVFFDSLPLSPLNTLQPIWTWKSGGGGGIGIYRCKVDDTNLVTGAVPVTTSQYSPTAPLVEGEHTLYVQERDSAGNWSNISSKPLLLSLRGTLGSPGFSSGRVNSTAMTLNNTGLPYVAFSDSANGYKVTVMRWTGGSWQVLGTPAFTAGAAGPFSLVLNSSGLPYVAFQDWAEGGKASLMRWTGTNWEYIGGPGFTEGRADNISLALNASGTPHVAFSDWSNGQKATEMYWTGENWEFVGTPGFSETSTGSFLSLALDAQGTSYVAFRDEPNNAILMRWSGTAWQVLGGGSASAGYADYLSLAIDKEGTPYLAYRDGTNGYKATVRRWYQDNWETVGSAGFTAGRADFISLALSSSGVPYIAFQDVANGEKATIMRFAGNSWGTMGVAGFSPGKATALSLAINSVDTPYITFQDESTGGKVTVMKTSFEP